MIYFDNSATSFPKPEGMIMAMENCMKRYCGNPGRSGHRFSIKMGEEIYESRKSIGQIIGTDHIDRLVFTKNTTEALNLALFGTLREGDHVITTAMEHNSVLRPLHTLREKGVETTILSCEKNGIINPLDINNAIRHNTKMIITTMASNVTGTIMNCKEIGEIARTNGVLYLVDGAQGIGCEPFDVEIEPFLYGGTGTYSKDRRQHRNFPEDFESGTVNGPGIIGLGYSARWLNNVGVDNIGNYERELVTHLENNLAEMKGVSLYGIEPLRKVGITLFNLEGYDSEDVTDIFNKDYNIAARGGFHCAGLAHKTIGTWEKGAVRLSVGPFNTKKEIDYVINAIWKLTSS